MAAAVEDDVLPDLVADRDRLEADAEIGQQRQVLGRKHRRGGIERIIEQHDLGFWRERPRQRRLGEGEARRLAG